MDTSALIYLNDFRKFDSMLTVSDVIKEVKDRATALKLSGLRVSVVEPAKQAVNEIRETAKATGDLEKLSKTDVKILALAKQSGSTIISDDHNVQNVAEKLSIPYISIFSKRITKLITWKRRCAVCNKYFDRGRFCSICGSRLRRVPVSSKQIKT